MKPASVQFREVLKDTKFMTPFCPVVHNVNAEPNKDPIIMADLLAQQIDNPVRWVESIQLMLSRGIEVFIEVGHGTVLQGLVKKIAGKDFSGIITGFSTPEDASWIGKIVE
jgi:[acyl-carrier-protein] S-malonyltransferase